MKQLLFVVSLIASCGWPLAQAQDMPGKDVESLLTFARERNPELTGMLRDNLHQMHQQTEACSQKGCA